MNNTNYMVPLFFYCSIAEANSSEWQNVQAAVIRRLPSKQASFCDKTSSRSLQRSYSSSTTSTRRRRYTQHIRRSSDAESSVDLLDGGGEDNDEEEQWRKRGTIKGMTASLDYKRRVRYGTVLLVNS